ncbi:MAG: hypothetical protein [Caudoviricetes sp.]|nr:MAG: hypothetical protein [Caudoviricetes sp.]
MSEEEKKYSFSDISLSIAGQRIEPFEETSISISGNKVVGILSSDMGSVASAIGDFKVTDESIKKICRMAGRPLPKLTAQMFGMGSEFTQLLRYLFDDSFDISEEFSKHSSCRVELGAEICEEVAEDIISSFKLDIDPVQLVGTWKCEAERSYNNGVHWDCVDEAIMVVQVTETKTVTSWKPISHVNQETISPQKQ